MKETSPMRWIKFFLAFSWK
jgi:hypothetical protein